MASDSVEKISGVGPKTAAELASHHILTVKELAEVVPETVQVTNINSLIRKAQNYVKIFESKVEAEQKQLQDEKVELGPAEPKAEPTPKAQEEEKKEEDETKADTYLLSDHTWFEHRVRLPRKVRFKGGRENHEDLIDLRKAVVYEMSVEPNHRVSMLCSWVDEENEMETLCTMTYSPQFIYAFNLDLPELCVKIHPSDMATLSNASVIENVLWEVHVMREIH